MTADPHALGKILHAGQPLDQASLAIVLLHGRGGSAADILSLANAFDVPKMAFLAPEANGSSWYPLSFLAPREANEPYLSSALQQVGRVIQTIETAGLTRDRIVVCGFSQGACLATEYVASEPARYASLIAFTGGLIGPPGGITHHPDLYSGTELAGTPALLSSGDPDPHVPWVRVEESAAVLRSMGANVTLKRYPGRPHTISAEELELARYLILEATR